MSSYLFVLTMERLQHAIRRVVSENRWAPIRLGRGEPPLSYLFFTDDLMLFGEVSMENAITMMLELGH